MYSIKRFLPLICLLCFIAPLSHADDGYVEIKAGGKPDAFLCGFDVNKTTMKEIFAKLGKEDKREPDPEESREATFSWVRGSLKISAIAWTIYEYPNRHPEGIEVEGADPEKFCGTGRGIFLGDSIDHARKIYAQDKGRGKFSVKKAENVTFKWGEEDTTVYFDIDKDRTITAVGVTAIP
ncbi:MAG: hypothetical protein P4L91_07015 [Burkholderiaceae bacterium]|nr:hypothetical protein [Burkholderiaceae bacterium]